MSTTPIFDAVPGLASITTIAALANPRRPRRLLSKTVILDAEIYVGSSLCESLLGALRFFNAFDLKLSAEPGLYLIYATFARMEADADVQSTVNAPSDYAFVRDLQWHLF
ncbi:hypothetical protein Hypma_003356 [Hypsizygus marmoreus]|uniref:Uncharacterized protein n=1 Tax=Hypsizygus marmoreus TaxID=39966 RepID=A0A369J6U6_HYPMA|nr:hypothetical protein Hypma_003356 [Hypsizygus marmoreus]